MALLVRLDDADARLQERVGGKGAALARLFAGGAELPATVCLTTEAYERFVDAAGLRPVIRQELGRKSFDDMRWEEIWDVALRIRNRFVRAPVPAAIAEELVEGVAELLGDGPLAVRSSAPGEDAEDASFAGLHDSFVGVRGGDDLLEAVRKVWVSLWTDRALLYRRELGIDPDASSMAVVLQRLVEGAASGVAFGRHPTRPDLLAVEAVHGLNQGMVDGTIEPDRWEVEPSSGRVVGHTRPEVRRRLVLADRGPVVETVEVDVPPLDDAGLEAVVAAVRSAGELFGAPQDVEWTLADGRLVVLQSRPVTTGAGDGGDRRSWYLSLTRSLDNLRRLRVSVEQEALPAMDREAEETGGRDLAGLDDEELVAEIEARREAHDRWVAVYWRDFIPFAHGIRLFGQLYNDVVRPDDPYEFMTLLAATPMLSVRRNRALGEMASLLRDDPGLRARLARGDAANRALEERIDSFLREFGGAVYAKQECFADRAQLVRLLLTLAEASATAVPAAGDDVESLRASFLARVEPKRRALAEEILDLGRASYRLRDDDNIHLARHEALVLDAVEEGRRRVGGHQREDRPALGADQVVAALRHPNLLAEPRPEQRPIPSGGGLRPRPRQLVGQPAGPGVAVGPARIVSGVDELFRFQPGEVLVCDSVDPNMTFVVPMAAAVVERRGGMLIHGAIIAREYGLPCVNGVPDATSLIRNGDHLTVDGYLGIVTVSGSATRTA